MPKVGKTPQDILRDRQQVQIFETTYGFLVDAAQSASPSLQVTADRLRANMNTDRTATGAIRIQSGNKSIRLPISMQGTAVWVKGEKAFPLPASAPKGGPGYWFENRQTAADYLRNASVAFATANPPQAD